MTLRGGELPWHPVSPRLRTVRWIVLGGIVLVVVLVCGGLALTVSGWFWAGVAVAGIGGPWTAWIVARQVSAMSWIELEEELVIRRGRMFRTLVSVPYGRMQYVDLHSGPLLRAFDLASVEIHTGSPESGGHLSGLSVGEAEALRTRLAARGESQRAGL